MHKGRECTIPKMDIQELKDEGMVQTTRPLEDWLGGLFQMDAFEP